MILLNNISSVTFRIKGSLCLLAVALLLFTPQLLKAQEEVVPTVYERPQAKIFKSLSAALQQPVMQLEERP